MTIYLAVFVFTDEKDFQINADHSKKKLVKAKKKDFVSPTTAPLIVTRVYVQLETEEEIVKFGDGWVMKYTNSSKADSALCSGWTTAHKEQYKELLKHIKRGRNKPTTPAQEALVSSVNTNMAKYIVTGFPHDHCKANGQQALTIFYVARIVCQLTP
jgi:hypothetical protein